MYQVFLAKSAIKRVGQIDPRYRPAIDETDKLLSRDPLSGKPLSGELKGQYSFRVGVYRIIYTFNSAAKVLYIINISHRKDVYRQ
jgi:mRNA interferase RelE/StbE